MVERKTKFDHICFSFFWTICFRMRIIVGDLFKILHFLLWHFQKPIDWVIFPLLKWINEWQKKEHISSYAIYNVFLLILWHIFELPSIEICMCTLILPMGSKKMAMSRNDSYTLCKYIPRGRVLFFSKNGIGSEHMNEISLTSFTTCRVCIDCCDGQL